MVSFTIPVSPDQEDVISDHILGGKQLGMVADERHWMMAHVAKSHPGHRITAADLDIENVTWTLTLEPKS